MNFEYQDGARMTTIGGVLVETGHENFFAACNFDALEFVRTSPESGYRIDVPKLTYRELRYLDRHLPALDPKAISTEGIPESDVADYAKFYRYFPTFAEADV
jgi:hypothetical protein